MKKRNKITLSISIILILGILTSGISYLIIHFLMDEPPPKDDDLQVTRLEIPEEENAFYYFDQAIQKLYWPEDKEKQILSILDGKEWDAEFANELLKKNKEVFEYFEQGLACSRIQVPEISGFDTKLPYLAPWRNIARLKSLYVLSLFKRGKEKEAFAEAMKIIKFGQMAEDSRGCLLNYLVGLVIKEIGHVRLRKTLSNTSLSPEVLRIYIERLANYKAPQKALAHVFRQEYIITSKTIDDLVAGKVNLEDFEAEYPKRLNLPFFFKTDKTKRMFAETYRLLIEDIPKNYSEMQSIGKLENLEDFSLPKVFLFENAIGEILYKMLLPALDRVMINKCRENVSVSVTQLLLALKCYKHQTGQLPESLNELVPQYFEKIPLDDFNGKPMKYSAEKKVIYSAGEDLKDSGGREKEDLIFRIDF